MQDRNDLLERGGSKTDRRRAHRAEIGASRGGGQQPSSLGADQPEFTGEHTHGFSRADFSEVALTSDGLGWTSAFVSRQRENPYQRGFAACADPLVSFVLNGPITFARRVNGVSLERTFVPGSFGIIPAGAAFDGRTDVPLESMQIYVRQAIVEEIAADLAKGDPGKLEIIPQFAVFDKLLEQLATGMCEAAQDSQPSSALYVDHLSRAFAARLVMEHSTVTTKQAAAGQGKGLSQRQLTRVNDYIEANLAAPLSLSDIARESHLSPNHFARLFKLSTGFTPYQHVMRRRIERAQRLLSGTNLSIAQIAFDSGFGDQVHLTQAFKRLSGMTPAAYRKMHSG